ncbi:hypothetical protein BS50DRAFT_637157 [Corynespora cassiicola Philippines]|uniref:CYTH domain-containing protein n=1 Tax=Corynespora cassiicola Philippines TaxID=1448308 RepID=A0A2T2NEK5_CORCC|nr:hypothetical protein BS50DRAFT_637157 [Corynespora cassiicola Philippines]
MPPFKPKFTPTTNIYPRLSSSCHLEIECKFAPTSHSLHLLRTNKGTPPFKSFNPLPTASFTDTYLDTLSRTLMSQGIYIRMRNGFLSAKVRHAGDYTNSRCTETSCEAEVRALCRAGFRAVDAEERGIEDLEEVAEIWTMREQWDIEGFRVVVDRTHWGHVVGEVEVEGPVAEVGDEDVADGRIERFMKEYEWAFPKGEAVGKLSAFLEWEWKGA